MNDVRIDSGPRPSDTYRPRVSAIQVRAENSGDSRLYLGGLVLLAALLLRLFA